MQKLKITLMTNPVVLFVIGFIASVGSLFIDLITQIPLDDVVNACYMVVGTAAISLGTWAFKKLGDRNAKS